MLSEFTPGTGSPRNGSPGKFFLIDGHSYCYQAFYAIGDLQTPTGQPVGVVFGFCQLIERLLSEKPSHLVSVFDTAEVTFRTKQYPDYKIHRPAMPEDLADQIPLVKEALEAYRIPVVELDGFEADDLIATLARRSSKERIPAYIISKDKDLEQLLDDCIRIFNPKDGACLDAAGLLAKKGIRPDQVIDFLALVGDSVDNVPGIHGIGPKTALKILSAVNSFQEVFSSEIPGLSPRLREKIRTGQKDAELSRLLVTLDDNCPVPGGVEPERYRLRPPDRSALVSLFRRHGFRRLIAKYEGDEAVDVKAESASARYAPPSEEPLPSTYRNVRTGEEIQSLAARLSSCKEFAVDTETGGLNPFRDKLVGISFALFEEDGQEKSRAGEIRSLDEARRAAREDRVVAYYVPLLAPEPLPLSPREILDALRGPLEDPAVHKIGQNIKFDMLFLRNAGVHISGVSFDTMVASYLLNPEVRSHKLDLLTLDYLGHRNIPLESLIGKSGKAEASNMEEIPLEKIRDYACEDADTTLRLERVLSWALADSGLEELMRDVETPLVEVLTEMELQGIVLDNVHMEKMALEIRSTLEKTTAEIHRLAGREFNVASPPQLAGVLYGELGLPPGPKGKSGVPSTAADVLTKLRESHPIVPEILRFRELTKLISTYVEALPRLVEPRTGRIHTSFNQAVAATGRLSSSNPNLQNIPVKTELGRQIRKAFIAGKPDHVLLSADYSQVELRVLAHLSSDPVLLKAFQDGEDIHRSVAAQIFGVLPEEVDSDMRRAAKTVNFGIIYGQTPFGLAQELGISLKEAAAMIEDYFHRHRGVKAFVDETIARTRREGSVRTILGRRRTIRDISSRNKRLQALAERTAVNSVVQGSAADLIKVAMNNIHTDQKERNSRAALLLQIHDELVLLVPRADLELEEARVRQEMVEAMKLQIPLVVNTVAGETWYEARE